MPDGVAEDDTLEDDALDDDARDDDAIEDEIGVLLSLLVGITEETLLDVIVPVIIFPVELPIVCELLLFSGIGALSVSDAIVAKVISGEVVKDQVR